MTTFGAIGKTTRLIAETQLDCFIPVAVQRPDLQNVTGTRFYHGNRNNTAVFRKDLRHPDFAAEQTFDHRSYLLFAPASGNVPADGRHYPRGFHVIFAKFPDGENRPFSEAKIDAKGLIIPRTYLTSIRRGKKPLNRLGDRGGSRR
jgi:hypothetical protein